MCVLFHGVRRRQVGSTRPYHAECRVDGSRPLRDRTCYSHSKERTHGGVHERSMSVDHAWDACARRGVGGGRHGCSGGTDLGSQLFRRERCDAIIFWAASWARALPLAGVWPSDSADCVCYSNRCCISRTRSATAVLSPDSESPGAHTQRHRPGPGPRVVWRGSMCDTAGGPTRAGVRVSWRGGEDTLVAAAARGRARPAPPAPPPRAAAPLLPHTLAQADSSGGRRSVPRGLSAPSLLPPSPTNRSRQRGWHRPPRGAARQAATADADTQERRDEEDGSGGTREEAAQQPHTTAGHDRWRTGAVRGGPALAPLCVRRTPGARCALRVCTALVPTTGRSPIFTVQWPRGVWWRGCAGCGAWRATGPSNAASGSEIGFSSFRSLALPDAFGHL